MDTKHVLLGQFKANTGTHMLDSGGAYGRHWQRNQERDLEKEQSVTIEAWEDKNNPGHSSDWYLTFNTFQWLNEYVDVSYDDDLQKQFEQFCDDENWDMQMSGMEAFAQHLIDEGKATGFQGDSSAFVINTYNHENLLDQTLQFVLFNIDGEDFVLLQVHGGADVRGGYTDAVVYSLGHHDGAYKMLDYARAGLSDGENNWYTDDGYNWYNDDSDIGDMENKTLKLDSDGNLLSPVNGKPLSGWFY